MSGEEGPKRISDAVHTVNITGYLVPFFKNGQPLSLELSEEGEDLYVAVFSTYEKLV